MIHGHGDDIYNRNTAIRYNFSSNVLAQNDNSWLQDFFGKNQAIFHSYPEPNATSFVKKLAEKNQVSPKTICATHGATDAIYLTAQAFAKSKTAILTPTFSEYEDACKIHQHKLSFYEDFEQITDWNLDMVWLCNPNNPTGQTWDKEALLRVIDANPNTVFVIDQTYRYFTPKPTLSYAEAVARKNVVLVDSFTKRFALPDLRLGYFIANEKLVEKIQFFKQPWAVSQLAIEVGKYLLETMPFALNLQELLKETKDLQEDLQHHKELKIYPTDTHFFLCKLQKGKASELKDYLLQKHQILIRDASNFRGLDESFFRIASQGKKANKALGKAVKQYFEEKDHE